MTGDYGRAHLRRMQELVWSAEPGTLVDLLRDPTIRNKGALISAICDASPGVQEWDHIRTVLREMLQHPQDEDTILSIRLVLGHTIVPGVNFEPE